MVKKIGGRFWFYIGIIGYIIISFSSIVRSYEPDSVYNNIYMAIDWLAACVIYFYLAALIGRIFDLKKSRHPLWMWLTLGLWLISSISAWIFAKPGTLSIPLILFFPFAFGVFFTGYAFSALFPVLITQVNYLKLILDFIFLGIFYSWLYLEFKNKSEKIRRTLLYLIFIIFFLGLAGCIRHLV